MAISTNAEVALTYPEGIRASDREKFQAISMAIEQMSQLTEDLLLLTRTDRVSSFEFQKIELTTLLTDLVNLYKSQADTKQIELKAEVESDLWLIGDEVKLARAFTNLIQNALQYTPAGETIGITASASIKNSQTHPTISQRDKNTQIADLCLRIILNSS